LPLLRERFEEWMGTRKNLSNKKPSNSLN
jgi:hypothetical protein